MTDLIPDLIRAGCATCGLHWVQEQDAQPDCPRCGSIKMAPGVPEPAPAKALTASEVERTRHLLESGDFPYPGGWHTADKQARIWLATVDELIFWLGIFKGYARHPPRCPASDRRRESECHCGLSKARTEYKKARGS